MSQLDGISDRHRFHDARTNLLFFHSFLSSQLFLFGAIAIVVLSPTGWLVADSAVHFKLLTAFLFSIDPIKGVVDFIEPSNSSMVSLNKLRRLEALLDEAAEADATRNVPLSAAPHIALRAAFMRHADPERDSAFEVGPLDLDLPPSSITFLVGGNGSGKTTLLKMLSGLYPLQGGRIVVDGRDLDVEGLADYRQRFAAVFSDFHLFRRLYGLEGVNPVAMESLVTRFGLAQKTTYCDGRFSKQDLSSGQRKRLALITALVEDRPILVCDEFAADQDPDFRDFFYHSILPELSARGKTVVVATHDDAYFDCCNQLVKMDKGRIVSAKAAGRKGGKDA